MHNFVQCSCKNIEQKCFIYHQIYHGDWKSHRECLINTCINGWRHGIEYTQVQKLSNLLQKCTYVQISVNYFHKTATGAVLFTGLPPFNMKSVSQYSIPHGRQARNMPDIWTGAGIAQWLERRIRDRKVAGSNLCRSGGRIFFSRVNFLCWLLFRCPFHPRVTAVARKRPRSFRQKCRWQVTAKHAYTLRMWLCMKWHGAWLYGVHRTRRDGSSFMWHQPCQRCKYTTSVDIQKRAIKSYSLM